jgi:uncharacterized protein YdiU (UPF0061 family)
MYKRCGLNFDTTYTSLPNIFFTESIPCSYNNPKNIVTNDDLAVSIGLDFSTISEQELCSILSGSVTSNEITPFSQAYAGHQYGRFTILGDGRACMLGEHLTPSGERFDIHLKGSGLTKYSKGGDGKAALGPMLREYIISEAMYNLGIPTTRSLAVTLTGESIAREEILPGAVLTRVAKSHIRVGTFEFARASNNKSYLKELTDYTIERHYPHLINSEDKALLLLEEVMKKQIDLIVAWMRVGFIHGVMNTDNMLVSGETIDYGPCAFMDNYDPETVFSYIDKRGRYSFANQPKIAQWNIAIFANALIPLIHEDVSVAVGLAEEKLNMFDNIYHNKWLDMMRAKIGLFGSCKDDEKLILDLLTWMEANKADYTNTFNNLLHNKIPGTMQDWYSRWQKRLDENSVSIEESIDLMKNSNPCVIPRNHIVDSVLRFADKGDIRPLQNLLSVLKNPYKEMESIKYYQQMPSEEEKINNTFCGT